MKNLLLRVGDYLFVLRPLILIPAWSFFLVGTRAGMTPAGLPRFSGGSFPSIACLSAILITAYLLNQVFDQESDRHNDKCHYLTRGIFRVRTVVFMAMVFFLVAAYLFRSVGDEARTPLVAALVLSFAYSLPPIRLVSRPFFDLMANAVGYGGIAFIVGFVVDGKPASSGFVPAIPYVLLVGATFLHTTILDAAGDRAAHKMTTTVLIGIRASAVIAVVLAVAGTLVALLVSFGLYGDYLPVILLSASLPGFLAAWIAARGDNGQAHRTSAFVVQFTTLLVTVAACVVWPFYLCVVLPLVSLSRLYYRARFDVSYPGPAKV